MKVGDLVKDFLTERVGIVMAVGKHSLCVLWTTKGLSLFEPGHREWCAEASLELL